MKKIKHLDFYESCMADNGKLPLLAEYNYQLDGLCECAEYKFIDERLFNYFEPTNTELMELTKEGLHTLYWGDGIPYAKDDINDIDGHHPLDRSQYLTPLRQTIVLFMAAINNEL